MTEGEELTQRKSAHRDRALRVHSIVLPFYSTCMLDTPLDLALEYECDFR